MTPDGPMKEERYRLVVEGPPNWTSFREFWRMFHEEGAVIEVPQHDGSILKLRKLDGAYDPTDKIAALNAIARAAADGEVLTGLLYVDPSADDLHAHLSTVKVPFNRLGEQELCPGSAMLDRINASLR